MAEYRSGKHGQSDHRQAWWRESQDKYREYLNSPEWHEKKRQRMQIDNFTCQMCGCKGSKLNPLNVHHMSYHHLYHEDVQKDLVTLCRSCHMGVHNMMNRVTNSYTGQRGWKDLLSVSMVSYSEFQRQLAEQGEQ